MSIRISTERRFLKWRSTFVGDFRVYNIVSGT
jgi:hypothetical protein